MQGDGKHFGTIAETTADDVCNGDSADDVCGGNPDDRLSLQQQWRNNNKMTWLHI